MTSIEYDSKLPFTCQVTGEYCGGAIDNIGLEIRNKYLFTIPISATVADKITPRIQNRIKKAILSELVSICQKKKK